MPVPLIAAAAIPAIGALVGGQLNAAGQQQQNKDSYDYSTFSYERSKRDNLEFWRMQNEYNSPQMQMKRYQEAGLNPNLIYGQGNSGNSGPIQSVAAPPPQFRSTEPGNGVAGGSLAFINSMYDLQIKQAQADNLKAQNTVIHEDALLKRQQRLSGEFDLGYKSDLRETNADATRERLRQLKTNIDLSINEDARRAVANSASVTESAERVLSMQSNRRLDPYRRDQMSSSTRESLERVRNLIKDGTTKDLDNALREKGINPNDPMWARIVGKLLTDLFQDGGSGRSLPSLSGSIYDWIMGN